MLLKVVPHIDDAAVHVMLVYILCAAASVALAQAAGT